MLKKLFAVVAMLGLTACVSAPVQYKIPTKKVENLEKYVGKRSVMLTIKYEGEQRGLGSGLILKSTPRGSIVMTNMHVCVSLQKYGGFVRHNNRHVKISRYKISETHDICIAMVRENLRVSSDLARHAPRKYDKLIGSGHPRGEPLTINKGTLTERMNILIMYGYKPCEVDDLSDMCLRYGVTEDVREMDSQYVSYLSAPGSSGSGVFNEQGQLVGLVFAGMGKDFSHSYIVPYEYILEFLQEEQYKLKWEGHKLKYSQSSENSRAKMFLRPKVLGVAQ